MDRIAAMSDEDGAADAIKRIGADTERLTCRNMKEQVAEHIQALCQRDPTFARRTMLPDKSMAHCFWYVNRKVKEFMEQEIKDADSNLASSDEIIAEGRALHHCVGGYVNRVAQQRFMILFLRQCEDISKPFYTVEVRGRKVAQVRGMRNCDATPEVNAFMDRWERQVLQAPSRAAA